MIDIKRGATTQLTRACPDARVYDEGQAQNIVFPAFLIGGLGLYVDKRLDNRADLAETILVTWVPAEDEQYPDRACRDVGNTLIDLYETVLVDVEANTQVWGEARQYTIADNQLRFQVTVRVVNAIRQDGPSGPLMQELQSNERLN